MIKLSKNRDGIPRLSSSHRTKSSETENFVSNLHSPTNDKYTMELEQMEKLILKVQELVIDVIFRSKPTFLDLSKKVFSQNINKLQLSFQKTCNTMVLS